MESIAPLAKVLGETEFYDFTEKVFTLPAVRALLMEAVNANNQAKEPSHGKHARVLLCNVLQIENGNRIFNGLFVGFMTVFIHFRFILFPMC